MKKIPHRDPEAVKADARKLFHGDTEKVPTTTIKRLVHRGVEIASRYRKADEFETMVKVIEAVPEWAQARIRSVLCDSKCGSCYSVQLRRWDDGDAWLIGEYLRVALRAINDGFNGLYVCSPSDSVLGGDQQICVGNGKWIGDVGDYLDHAGEAPSE
jgi:hypothetical protein